MRWTITLGAVFGLTGCTGGTGSPASTGTNGTSNSGSSTSSSTSSATSSGASGTDGHGTTGASSSSSTSAGTTGSSGGSSGGEDTGTSTDTGETSTGTTGGLRELFSAGPDTVDFANVVAGTYVAGTQYNALDGDDMVTLPIDANAATNAGFLGGMPFSGGPGNDILIGGDNADPISGDLGNDQISGGGGDDFLGGGPGDDILTGGTGADPFVYTANTDFGTDHITDLSQSDGDMLIVNLDAACDLAAVTTFGDDGNGHLQIDFDAGGTIIFDNVPVGAADWTDFEIGVGMVMVSCPAVRSGPVGWGQD